MSPLIYKICSRSEWTAAVEAGVYEGSRVDHADGFIHFSNASQLRGTASKHFAGQTDLVLVTVDCTLLPEIALRWEPSRGGDLFPHLYAPLSLAAAVSVDPLPWREGEGHQFPETVDA